MEVRTGGSASVGDVHQLKKQWPNISTTRVPKIQRASPSLSQIHCNGIGDVCRHIPYHVIHIVSEFSSIPCCCVEKRESAACQSVRDCDQFCKR